MASKVIQARVPEEMYAWVAARGMKQVVMEALQMYRHNEEGGGVLPETRRPTDPGTQGEGVGSQPSPLSSPQKSQLVRAEELRIRMPGVLCSRHKRMNCGEALCRVSSEGEGR